MIKLIKQTGYWLLGLFFLVSCGDEDLIKFNHIEGIKNWEPDLTLTLAQGDYTVWKLINQYDEDSTIIERDNQIIIRHFEENIYELDVKDVLELPERIADFQIHIPLGPGLGILNQELEFATPVDTAFIKFDEGRIKRMFGSTALTYQLPAVSFKYDLKITFPNLLDEGKQAVSFTIEDAGTHTTGRYVLENVEFDMQQNPNSLLWKAEIWIPADEEVDANEVELSLRLEDFHFTRVEGRIDERVVDIPADYFNMDIEFWDNFSGNFHFVDPRVDLVVYNYGLAVPVRMDMNFTAYGEGKSLVFEAKDGYQPEFSGWIPDGEAVRETRGYNKDNSNIAELLSLPPKDKIAYSGQAIVSPYPDRDITILSDGIAKMDAYVEIPLHLSARDLVFKDTIDDIDISDTDKFKAARITVKAVNNIPLELGEGHLYLLDGASNCIDSVAVTRFIDAPEVDANGEVKTPVKEKSTPPIVLSEENIKNLSDTKFIVISVKAATSNNGEIPTVIKADATLKLKLQLSVKFDLSNL